MDSVIWILVCDATTPKFCLISIIITHKTCFTQIFNHSVLQLHPFLIYMLTSHFSQWLHSGLPIGHRWYERVDWLLCAFLLMVYFSGFHPVWAVLGGWIFSHSGTQRRGVCKCIVSEYSEQVFSGSSFNLQVGQLPVLTELCFLCHNVSSAGR